MRIEELKRGHWLVIAIMLGTILAWVQGFWGASATQTNAPAQFEMLLYRPPVKGADGKTYPQVRDITIYPAVDAGFSIERASGQVTPRKSVVSYSVLTAVPEKKGWTYKPAISLVDEPFRPISGRTPENPNLTIQQYLKDISANRNWITARYAWWAEPRWSYTIWIGGCVLVLGVIWPTVQNRLVAAGYGTVPEPKEKRESWLKRLFRRKPQEREYASSSTEAQRKAASATLSDEDLARIAKMEAELADFAKSGGDKEMGGEVDETQPAPVKQLNAGPLDVKQAPEAPKPDQDYDGEFYPTVAHAKKKPDAQP